MKLGRAVVDRFVTAFQRAIENSISRLVKDSEVHVSVVVRPKQEKDLGPTEGGKGSSGAGHP